MVFKWYFKAFACASSSHSWKWLQQQFYPSSIPLFKGICRVAPTDTTWANTEALPLRASLQDGIPGMLLELSAPWRNPQWIQQDKPGQKAGPGGAASA